MKRRWTLLSTGMGLGIFVPTVFMTIPNSDIDNIKYVTINDGWNTSSADDFTGEWIYRQKTSPVGQYALNRDFWTSDHWVSEDAKEEFFYIGDFNGNKNNPIINIEARGLKSELGNNFGFKITSSKWNFSSAEHSRWVSILMELYRDIIRKFRNDYTEKFKVGADNFHFSLDSQDKSQSFLNSEGIVFNSSSDVYNSGEASQTVNFEINSDSIFEQIGISSDALVENIVLDTIKPKNIGLIPFVQVFNPPIAHAKFTTNTIKVIQEYGSDYSLEDPLFIYPGTKQDVPIPPSADKGFGWWSDIATELDVNILLDSIYGGGEAIPAVVAEAIADELTAPTLLGGFKGLQDAKDGIQGISELMLEYSGPSLSNDMNNAQKGMIEIYNSAISNKMSFGSWYESDGPKMNMRPGIDSIMAKNEIIISGTLWADANATTFLDGEHTSLDLGRIIAFIDADLEYTLYK